MTWPNEENDILFKEIIRSPKYVCSCASSLSVRVPPRAGVLASPADFRVLEK
jgi:hypothetical protein